MEDFIHLMRSVTQHRDLKRKTLEDAAIPYQQAKHALLIRAEALDRKGQFRFIR